MEKQKSTLSKQSLTYGLYLGLVGIVLTVILYATDLFLNTAAGMGTLVVSIALLCWVYIDFKKNHNGGVLTFGDGFKLGFYVNVISGLIATVFKAIYIAFIDPSTVQKTIDYALQEAYKAQPDMPDEGVQMIEKIYGFIAGPVGTIIAGIVGTLIVAAIISLILAAIFKKEPSIFDGSEIVEEA